MVVFKDISSYSQGQVDRTPTTFETRVGGCRLIVTRHIHYENQWRIRFGDILDQGIEDCPADKAQKKAVTILKGVLTKMIKEL